MFDSPEPEFPNQQEIQQQAQQGRLQNAQMANPNFITPFGSQTVSFEGDQPTVQQTLSPELQNQFDLQGSLFNLAQEQLPRAQQALGTTPDNLDPFTVSPGVAGRNAVTDALIERQQPLFDRQREQAENDLLIRGFNPGTEGFTNRMDDLNRQENDARLAAILAGGQEQSRIADLESQRRSQQLQEQSFLRNLPFQDIASLTNTFAPTAPTFPGFTATSGPNDFDAFLLDQENRQNAFNQNLQNQQAQQAGLFDLVGNAASLAAAPATGGTSLAFAPVVSGNRVK